MLARPHLFDEPCPGPADLDAAELPGGRGKGRLVSHRFGKGGGPFERPLRGVQVDLGGRGDEPLAELRPQDRLPQLQ